MKSNIIPVSKFKQILHKFLKFMHNTAETRYNEGPRGPRGWQNRSLHRGFVISRFFFIYFTIIGVKKIVRSNCRIPCHFEAVSLKELDT